jgi:hypothetical protein
MSNSLPTSVAGPHNFDADPDPDPSCHFDADPDTFHVDADSDPTFYFDSDPDPVFQIKAQNLEKVLI